ncbi:MAG: YdjY domain-containing protein, partial [Planctomycetaceae bacterium]|nr:YdjY domain-containing protein [Planctomycetaceae bacterium]
WDSLLIGLAGAFAVLPGISFTGSTIVVGLARGLKREEAAIFSFLLAIPVIACGGLLAFCELVYKYKNISDAVTNLLPPTLLFGVVVSFISGSIALVWLLRWLHRGDLYIFAVWVLLLSPLAFGLAFNTPQPKGRDYIDAPICEPDEHKHNNDNVDRSNDNDGNPDVKHTTTIPATTSPQVVNKDNDTDNGELTKLSNMTDEERAEAIREVERIIEAERVAQAEQDAREIAAPPIVDDETKLVKLDPTSRVWVEKDDDGRKRVIVLGVVVLRDKPIELFACRRRSKEHESIVALNVKPNLIHAALLLTGAKPGKPVEFMPKFVPPSGEQIDVRVRWLDKDGKRQECPAADWIAMANEFDEVKQDDGSVKKVKRTMNTHWVFTGSTTFKDDENVTHYVADETGEIIGTSNFVGSILDVPIESSDQNSTLMFEANTERIPSLGTPVTLVLEPAR